MSRSSRVALRRANPVRAHRSRASATILLVGLSFALAATTGCLTAEVRQLVEDSNTAIVSATLLRGTPGVDPAGAPPETQEETLAAIQSIDDFIAQNPGRTRMVASLRVRQAVLYLNSKQSNRARAAFDLVSSEDDLASERDRTLYRIREPLVWWYAAASRPAWTEAERVDALSALGVLGAVADSIPDDAGRPPSITFLIEQMCVRIALRAALASSDIGFVKARVSDDVVRYAGRFDRTDREQIAKLCRDEEVAEPRLEMLRWYPYTATVFDAARDLWSDATDGEEPAPPSPLPGWTDAISRAGCPGFAGAS